MNNIPLAQELLSAYRTILTEKGNFPDWAVHRRNDQSKLVSPSIPFVGKNYADQPCKILVYASAENLSNYYPGSNKERPWLDDDTQAIDRHRLRFDASKEFFPDVHIQPMNNGCLATAVLYIASKFLNISNITPREFYEKISIANYGKYTKETEHQENIRTGKGNFGSDINIDYTQMQKKLARERLEESHPFLNVDIEVLRPDIIIVPKTLHHIDNCFLNNGSAKIIEIHQINTGVINRTISKKHPAAMSKNLPLSVQYWYNELSEDGMTGATKEKYLSVFSYLDQEIEKLL